MKTNIFLNYRIKSLTFQTCQILHKYKKMLFVFVKFFIFFWNDFSDEMSP